MSPQQPPQQPLKPKKPRTGRRQFPGMHGGTHGEWKKAMQSPDVQRALADPGIQQALYQNLQQMPGGMAGMVPALGAATPGGPPPGGPPMGMQSGGIVDATEINEIVQQLNDPSTSEARKMALRSSLARLMRARPPQLEDSTSSTQGSSTQGYRGGGALHFQTGGMSYDDAIQMYQDLAANTTDRGKQAQYNAKIADLQAKRAQQQSRPQLGSLATPGGNISGSTMSGLGRLAQMGAPSYGNTAAAMAAGALQGLGSSRQPGLSALVGAATAGALNYFIRKYGKGAQQQGGKSMQARAQDTPQGRATALETYPPNPNLQDNPPGTGGGVTTPKANTQATPANAAPTPPSPPPPVPKKDQGTQVQSAEAWKHPGWNPPPQGSADTPDDFTASYSGSSSGSPGGSGPSLWMGTSSSGSGNVYSNDGKTWRDQGASNKIIPSADVAPSSITQITPDSSLANATQNTTIPAPTDISGLGTTAQDLMNPYLTDPSLLTSGLGSLGFQKGGHVPPEEGEGHKAVRLGMAVPVLHTTIVIAAKPKGKKTKPEQKQEGGVIRAAKPHLLPPRRGPQEYLQDRPRPHGRVQVPRGSGAAIRGKRFGGIF